MCWTIDETYVALKYRKDGLCVCLTTATASCVPCNPK